MSGSTFSWPKVASVFARALSIVVRDANGRTKMAAPVDSDDVANKQYVDQHTSLVGSSFPHGAAVDTTAWRLVNRDGNGRAKMQDPADPLDIANKNYVDTQFRRRTPFVS